MLQQFKQHTAVFLAHKRTRAVARATIVVLVNIVIASIGFSVTMAVFRH